MKIKSDFVTNSSSSSFLFIFRGSSLHNLYKAMKDNWRWFEYKGYDNQPVNVYDMIYYEESRERIETPIEDKIIEIQKEIKSLNEFIKNNPKCNLDYVTTEIQKFEKTIEILKYKKKKGFETTVELSFSNHDNIGLVISENLTKLENNNLIVIPLGYNG
jgi:hypothetical protein